MSVNGHLVHQFPHRRIHIFFLREGVEIDLLIENHPRHDEWQTVVSSFLVSRVPLLRIRVFLPQSKVEFHFDRSDLLRARPSDEIRCNVLAENLSSAYERIALIAFSFAVRRLDGGSAVGTGGETEISRERSNVGDQAPAAFEWLRRSGHPCTGQHRRPNTVAHLFRTMSTLPHRLYA